MPKVVKNKLVNRSAGLYSGGEHGSTVPPLSVLEEKKEIKNLIAFALRPLVVPIEGLILDPVNARLHPERNLNAIKASLLAYGQVKPIVVRKATNVVVAGNGTLEAARQLGWTELAVSYVDMTEVEAAGYGLADNRTAELAKWDFEVVARLDKLLQEANAESIGWTADELEILRAADWTPPPIQEGGNGEPGGSEGNEPSLLVSFTPDQYVIVGEAIRKVQEVAPELDQAACLETICSEWITGSDFNIPKGE